MLIFGRAPSAAARRTKAEQETDIREAIVRYQIATWDLRADVYFVEIQAKDPDAIFLQRFTAIEKPVRPKSGAKQKKDVAGFHIEERRTKKRGVIFDQGSITWQSDSAVAVEGGYVCASLCMGSGLYHLSRQGNLWKVTSFEIRVIS